MTYSEVSLKITLNFESVRY